jgi:hypothetical protein
MTDGALNDIVATELGSDYLYLIKIYYFGSFIFL